MREASDLVPPDPTPDPAAAARTAVPALPGDRTRGLTPATSDERLLPTEIESSSGRDDGFLTTLPTATRARGSSPRPGESIRGYRLESLLGRGGMGEVWLAHDPTLRRRVALKLMATRSESGWTRFAREARALAALDHPHIARLYEFGDDPPFLAMQYVDGAAIDEARGDRIAALRDVARAVHHAHVRGVLHRDLKPANMIVDREGAAYVLDFGLAHLAADGDTDLTVSGQILGTPAFMAPEQARGDIHAIDARTDVYGLGATLYALLAGRAPFAGDSRMEVVRRVIEDEPEAPPGHPDLVAIALTAMAKDPARRYGTAAAMADDLDRHLGHEPVRARRPGLAYRLRRSIERRPLVWALGGALVAALVAGGAFGVEQMRRALAAEQAQAADLARALTAELARGEAEASRVAALDLGAFVDRQRRALAELDDALAMPMDDAELAAAYAALARVDDDCAARARGAPGDAVLALLRGQSLAMRSREEAAIACFDEALSAPAAGDSVRPGTSAEAHLARARARLRLRFHDLMARLFALEDQDGYLDAAQRDLVNADLAAAPTGGSAYDRRVIELWSGYLDAFATDMNKYYAVHDRAKALAAAGGRRCEDAWLLVGIVHPFPRTGVVEAYTAAIDRYHAQPRALALRATERLFTGERDTVIADAGEAIRLKPDYGLAYFLRARATDARSDPAAAARERADLDAAVRLEPKQPLPLSLRAVRRFRDGDYAGARADLDAATARETPRTGETLGTVRAGLAREAGIPIAVPAGAADRGGIDTLLVAATVQLDHGDVDGARAVLKGLDAALARSESETTRSVRLAEVRAAALAGDGAAAEIHAEAALRRRLSTPAIEAGAAAEAAAWLLAAGRVDAALATADRALADDAVEAQALIVRAAALAAGHRDAEAAIAREAALAALPAWTAATIAEGSLWDAGRVVGLAAALGGDDARVQAARAAADDAQARARAAFARP